jgi:hypothetical protein
MACLWCPEKVQWLVGEGETGYRICPRSVGGKSLMEGIAGPVRRASSPRITSSQRPAVRPPLLRNVRNIDAGLPPQAKVQSARRQFVRIVSVCIVRSRIIKTRKRRPETLPFQPPTSSI